MSWIETYFKLKIFAPLIIFGIIFAIVILMLLYGVIEEYLIKPIKKKFKKK